ncbi:MAG: pyrroline-5-carboxylate reductase [Clostridia bacterium]|nr:pyrroline-5-carboxylate reductase [Clostridia bacterium]
MKKIICMVLALVLLCTAVVSFAEGPGGGRGGNGGPGGGQGGMRGGNGGGTDKSGDAELQTMITEVAPKFQLLTYDDAESGTSLQYQLYIPENYDEAQSYPMIQFIPDASAVGRGTDYVLTQGWGGLIWATEEEQAKHPAFVVVPVFTETVVDDNFNHSSQIDTAMRLLQSLTETYSIDTDRIYTTGQSMGGMTSFHLSIEYPDFFAAYLFVGSQWNTSLLDGLEQKNFFYVVSAGDPKASAGQAELIALFDTDGAAYSHAEWSAQDDAETQKAAVASLLKEGNKANFVTFTLGTTLAEGQTAGSGAGEHMTSFDFAYKLEAVRDWLFEQSR